MRGLAAMSVSNPGLACAVCRLLRPVFRESREESFKGAFSNLIVDFSSPFCLQDCVVMHPEDVVDTADAKAFAKECKSLSEDPGTAEHVRALLEPRLRWLRAGLP